MPTSTASSIVSSINEHLEEITAIRHDLHAHPQILFTEEYSSQLIQDELTKLGITFRANMGGKEPGTGYGVMAHIPATVDAPAIASGSARTWTPCRSPR